MVRCVVRNRDANDTSGCEEAECQLGIDKSDSDQRKSEGGEDYCFHILKTPLPPESCSLAEKYSAKVYLPRLKPTSISAYLLSVPTGKLTLINPDSESCFPIKACSSA